jgi:hypothetical protein
MTWVGFQPQEGGAVQVFVQLDREVGYQQEVKGGALVVTLDRAVYGNRNARRHLDSRFFETAVAGISSKRVRRRGAGPGIQLTIRFKNPADAREADASMITGKDGWSYLLLELGPPSAPASD